MTLALVTALALLVGLSIGIAVFGLVLVAITVELKNSAVRTLNDKWTVEAELRLLSDRRAELAESKLSANVRAIETNSLPWFPKNDKLEARYENEAVDKMENPSFYSDIVDGLGGLR